MGSSSNLLVSGAAGFLGRRVLRAALGAGYRVTAVIRACERESARELVDVPVVELDWDDEAALADLLRIASPTAIVHCAGCLLYTSPSPRDRQKSRMPSSA